MKTRFYKALNKILTAIMPLFGLACTTTSCETLVCEYGSPHATFQLNGTITDKTTGNALPNIRLAIAPTCDTIRTDQDGKFSHEMSSFFIPNETLTITAEDTDGPENGGAFATTVVSFAITEDDQIAEGNGSWDHGTFSKTIDIAMEPQADLTFAEKQAQFAGIDLPYREAEIAPTDSTVPALVVYLHGGTSRGTDNDLPMAEKAVNIIAQYLASRHIHAIFVVPQCPEDKDWTGSMSRALRLLIGSYEQAGRVDAGRMYVLGGSMGGTGTWRLLTAYPRLFAAAMPVAGSVAQCVADSVAQTPTLTVMGSNDRIMDIEPVSQLVDAANRLQGEAVLQVENDWTHETTCTDSYTDSRLDWVFAHVRKQ